MLGYNDWRDVRNDLILLAVLSKLVLVGYLVFDWVRFGLYGYSYVIGSAVTRFGWDSPVTETVRHVWRYAQILHRVWLS